MDTSTDLDFMAAALEEAQHAAERGEVPIGAVVVCEGVIVGRGFNLRETSRDPTAHAEMIAIREASAHLGRWRLIGCTLYVTLEPCPMCMGALILARIERLVFGPPDPKGGAAGTLFDLSADPRLNHSLEVVRGVRADECGLLLSSFFARLRKEKKARH